MEDLLTHIHNGGLIVLPTDTVYGIGCDPFNSAAITALYKAKKRPADKSIPVLVSSIAKAHELGHISPACEALLAQHWPGALTVIVKQKKHFPKEISADDTIALRMPNHTLALSVIEQCGGALAVSSANLSGQPPARSAEEARRVFEKKPYVEGGQFFRPKRIHIIDGGVTLGGIPSTIIDCTREPFSITRPGPITIA